MTFCPVYADVVDDWLTIALAAGLCARLTRLITLDVITEPIRRRLPGLLGALVECSWCTGVWAGIAVGLSWVAWSDQGWWQATAVIGTIAWVAGAVSGAAMPSQHEVATVSPVALVNADEPQADPVQALTTEQIEAAVKRVLVEQAGRGESGGERD